MGHKKLDIDIIKKYYGNQKTDHTDRNYGWDFWKDEKVQTLDEPFRKKLG